LGGNLFFYFVNTGLPKQAVASSFFLIGGNVGDENGMMQKTTTRAFPNQKQSTIFNRSLVVQNVINSHR
jgi:hypothetical protein